MKITKPFFFLFIVSFVILFSFFVLNGEEMDKAIKPAFDSIDSIAVYNYCKTMASPRFAGRLTGHEGYTEAAKWAAGKFKEWGLKPIEPKTDYSGFLQSYPSPYVVVDKSSMTLYIDGTPTTLKPEDEFLPLLFSASGKNKAGVVFVGWGISAPELGYDDYQGIDVKGKFVLCFRGTPDPENLKYDDHDQHRTRMKTAKEHGSIGLIYIYDEVASNPNGDWIQGFTPAEVSFQVGDKILKEKNFTAAALKKELLSTKKPKSFSLDKIEVELEVESRNFPDGIGYNVAGYIEGSDPVLKKECIVVGAHFDHNGTHMGLMFPGANDNASGSAVVMELARTLAIIKTPPKQSIVFVLFGGEEKGLMGSNYFSDHLPEPFTKVKTMLNFDMEGEGGKAFCVFSKEPPLLEQSVKWADTFVKTLAGTRYMRPTIGVRSSDFAPFFLKGAACMSFYSNGPHINYHKSTDDIYRINPEIMGDITKLAFLTVWKLAIN